MARKLRAAKKAKAAPRRKALALSQSEIMRTKGDLFVHPYAVTFTGKVDKTAPAKIAALPFVRSRKRGEKGGRFFWSVTSSGNYFKDYDQGRAWARLMLPHLKYNDGPALLSWIVADMIGVGERVPGKSDGLVLGFVREIGNQLKTARLNLFIAAAATDPRKVPTSHRKGAAAIREVWRDGRPMIMKQMADAI
jgi:hypothetical protein